MHTLIALPLIVAAIAAQQLATEESAPRGPASPVSTTQEPAFQQAPAQPLVAQQPAAQQAVAQQSADQQPEARQPDTEQPAARSITLGTLLEEMADLASLARWPDPEYRTVQLSSFDRRSTTAEAPGWFSNADGFGREPIPGFAAVLRAPDSSGVGLYLVADAIGPGAVVRGWSAGMGGILRVYLDGADKPSWEGPAYDFLARRSGHCLKTAGLDLDAGDAFTQNDADYFPVPFAKSLKVTWEGKLDELHFYHLQVRRYSEGTRVEAFDPSRDVKTYERQIRAAVAALTEPAMKAPADVANLEAKLEPRHNWGWALKRKGPGAIAELRLKLSAENIDEALRGVRLRISFDGSQRPQVEAPVGDFFASGPGVNPFSSLPFTVEPDGTMVSRFVMPFSQSVEIDLENFTTHAVGLEGRVKTTPWTWDDRSMYFRAKWRADHDLLAGAGAIDLPYAVVIGQGVFAGCAAMIMNPSGVPTAGGNWWGEGDEKILADGEAKPSTFGTGSEDYFNYSWSRSDLFDHPYCGQPLDSGPDTAGYVSNHRFQILDAIPFGRSLAVYLELWSHNLTPGLSYSRIAYHYARPGAVDDHRGLMPSDLRIPPLPPREPQMLGGAAGGTFRHFEDLKVEASAGEVAKLPLGIATRKRVVAWKAEKGARLKFMLPVEKAGEKALHIVAVHRPDGATLRLDVGGKPVATAEGSETFRLKSPHVARNLNVHFAKVKLAAGENEVALECVEPGFVGLDYVWVR